MKDNKLNRKTLDKILTEYFDETALSDDDAKIILDYHNFDDETLIELALGVVGLAWGTSGRKVVDILDDFDQLDEPEPKNITLQDVTDKLWELPLNSRKLWLARLNDEFQEGYIVPLGLKTTDGEEQYLTYNGSYFASRRNKYLQQTFDTLEEIPEFYRGLAERVL